MVSLNRFKIYEYITALVAAFPLLGRKAGNAAVILWAVYSLFISISTKAYKIDRKDVKNIIVLSALYISYILSFIFASDKHEAGKLLERTLPFFLFPLFMVINKQYITYRALRLSLKTFALSSICLGIYVWGVIFSQGIQKVFSEDQYYNPVIRNIFSNVTDIHLPYLGMLFVFAAAILLFEMYASKKKNYLTVAAQLAGIIFLLISVATFMARTSLLIFFVVAVFFSLRQIKKPKQLIGIALVGVIVATCALLLPSSQRRIKESLASKYELPHAGQPSEEVNFRYGVYHCVIKVIKANWLTGVGVENVQKELDECYSSYTYEGSDDYNHISYNSHNQYFDIILKYGIFGLALFMVSLLWGIRTNYLIYQGFLIIIFIALITENVFTRQVGVIFFTFFNTLFFVAAKKAVFKEPLT